MKKILFVLAFIFVFPLSAMAHPGRTASDGCHYCRTNCASWGEVAGARHCHGGGSAPAPKPTVNTQKKLDESIQKVIQKEEDNPLEDIYLVTGIVDGDTIKVQNRADRDIETVRIIGIDTPETVDPRKPVQCFGKEATQKMTLLLQGRFVKLAEDRVGDTVGTYGRLIRYVHSGDTDIGLKMIQDGYAYAYTKYPFENAKMEEYKAAENEARLAKRGLWADGACNDDPVEKEQTVATTTSSLPDTPIRITTTSEEDHDHGEDTHTHDDEVTFDAEPVNIQKNSVFARLFTLIGRFLGKIF